MENQFNFMNILKIIETLSPIEREVLPFIKNGIELKELTRDSKKKDVEVMRALQWLENKKAVKINSATRDVLELGSNGKMYVKEGLPEKRFLKGLKGKMTLEDIRKAAKLDNDEVRVCLGLLKSKYAITILGGVVETTAESSNVLKKVFSEEEFLKKLPKDVSTLSDEENSMMKRLFKRKNVVCKNVAKLKYAELTGLGKKLVRETKNMKIDLLQSL